MKSRSSPKATHRPAAGFSAAFQPYIFVLKEGKKIKEDFLDYSLLLLQTSRIEVLKSPKKRKFTFPSRQRSV